MNIEPNSTRLITFYAKNFFDPDTFQQICYTDFCYDDFEKDKILLDSNHKKLKEILDKHDKKLHQISAYLKWIYSIDSTENNISKVRYRRTKEKRRKINILEKYITNEGSYFSCLWKDYIGTFKEGVRLINEYPLFFFSYSNRIMKGFNNLQNRIKIEIAEKPISGLKNYLAYWLFQSIRANLRLNDKSEYFFDKLSIDEGKNWEKDAIKPACEASYSFVQLVQSAIFDYDVDENTPYKEFAFFDLSINKGSRYFIQQIADEELKEEDSEYGYWMGTIRKSQCKCKVDDSIINSLIDENINSPFELLKELTREVSDKREQNRKICIVSFFERLDSNVAT